MTENLKRYDVVLVNFGYDVLDGEQGGIRPAVLVQNDVGNHFSKSTIVIPFSTKLKHIEQPTHSVFKKSIHRGLSEDSMALGECLRQVSEQRIIKYLGRLEDIKDQNEIKRIYFASFGD